MTLASFIIGALAGGLIWDRISVRPFLEDYRFNLSTRTMGHLMLAERIKLGDLVVAQHQIDASLEHDVVCLETFKKNPSSLSWIWEVREYFDRHSTVPKNRKVKEIFASLPQSRSPDLPDWYTSPFEKKAALKKLPPTNE